MIDGIKKSVDERAITLDLSVEVWQAHPRKLGYCQALGARRHCHVPVEPHQHAPLDGGRGPFSNPRAAARGGIHDDAAAVPPS